MCHVTILVNKEDDTRANDNLLATVFLTASCVINNKDLKMHIPFKADKKHFSLLLLDAGRWFYCNQRYYYISDQSHANNLKTHKQDCKLHGQKYVGSEDRDISVSVGVLMCVLLPLS